MEIKDYGTYCGDEILRLYSSVGWTAYTDSPEILERAFIGSLAVLGAYEDDRLVGILRAIGDGASVLFIQDILVYPACQRQGIGTALMREILSRYGHVRQIELATDDTEKTRAFYEAQGFRELRDFGCRGFMRLGGY